MMVFKDTLEEYQNEKKLRSKSQLHRDTFK